MRIVFVAMGKSPLMDHKGFPVVANGQVNACRPSYRFGGRGLAVTGMAAVVHVSDQQARFKLVG